MHPVEDAPSRSQTEDEMRGVMTDFWIPSQNWQSTGTARMHRVEDAISRSQTDVQCGGWLPTFAS